MSFKHKLSRRLAALVGIAVVGVIACELPLGTRAPGPTVAQLIISPKALAVQPNQDADFTAVGLTAQGDTADVSVTWSATGGTITDNGSDHGRHYGRYRSAACGDFKVAATSNPGERSDTASVSVTCAVPVATVEVAPAPASVDEGKTVQLAATLKDAAGSVLSGRTVTWSSSNTSVATVNGSGLVTGRVAGTATITAASEGQSGSSAITVTVVPVASVAVTPAQASVDEGKTVQLTATPKDAAGNALSGRTVMWTSSNTSVATVNGSGLVTGKVAGTATITATSEGQSGTAAITVNAPPPPAPVASVTLAPATATVDLGQTVQLTATLKDSNGNVVTGRVVTWSSSNTTVATVSGSGLVTGKAAGPATITATSEGQSGTAAITVNAPPPPPPPVASVTVTPATANVDETKTVQLTPTLKDASGNILTGRTVTWASDNTTVATVSGSGLVTGKVAGTATITATSEGQSGTAAITVVHVPVASVAVSPASGSVQEGSTLQLTATPKDASGNPLSGRTVTWASSNTSVATVNGSGLVTGVVAGSATITGTSEGQSGTSALTVTPKPPPGTGVVFVGAGDISDCGNNNDEATAKLLDAIPGTVFTLGDNVYSSGTATEFSQCYDPTWGRHKARTRPAPGNHDYNTSGATGYYGYYGALAGPLGRGYYSYDLGDWHIISLNSNVSMSAGSAQEQWLRADLAASTKRCTLAYWHHPRFSSGTHGSSTASRPLWQALYDYDADLILVGHDHNYQRFAPQTAAGVADPVRGIREFVVGTGGVGHYNFSTPIANTEAYNNSTYGVLKLTLNADSYTWEFIPVAGQSYRDSGTGSCH